MSGKFTHLAEVGSTNDWLLARARDLQDGHWVVADRQTAGRGRRGRAWGDGTGNLMASVLVRNVGPVQQLSFVAALALREALIGSSGELVCQPGRDQEPGVLSARNQGNRAGGRARDDNKKATARYALKWPNDVLLDGAKVSGILLERADDALVIGFGVNLAMHPANTERPATSLAAAGLTVPAPLTVLVRLMSAFAAGRALWEAQGFVPIRDNWLAHAAGVGDRIAARLGTNTLEGRFEGLGDDGALALRLDDGQLRPVHAGEVFAL